MSAFVTTNIRGTDYKLAKLVPTVGGRIAVKVGAILAAAAEDGTAIKILIDTYKSHSEGTGAAPGTAMLADTPALLQALAGGIAKIDADALYSLAMQCVVGNLFARHKLHDSDAIDAHFSEHPDHLLLVLAWALKENCAGFFGLAGRA